MTYPRKGSTDSNGETVTTVHVVSSGDALSVQTASKHSSYSDKETKPPENTDLSKDTDVNSELKDE